MRRILTIACLFLALAPLRAQVATVEVSRPYDVNLDGIQKPAIPVFVDDSLHRFDVHFDYSIFNRPYSDLYDFTPYETIQLATVGANRTPFVYGRFGTQYAPGDLGLLPSAELYLQTKPKKGFCSGLYGRHNSFFGDLGRSFDASPVLKTARMQNTAGGDLTYDWSTGELMFDVKYDYDQYKYTAEEPWQQSMHRNRSLTAAINLNSAQKEENTVYYDVTMSYRNTLKTFTEAARTYGPDTARLNEGFLKVNGYVGATFEKHRVYVNMNIEYASYSGVHDFNIGVVEFSPIYQLQLKRLNAKLGVKFGSRYGIVGEIEEPGLDLSARSNIFPDLDIRYTIVDKALWAHAVITGGNDLNPYSRMIDDCPVVLPTSTMDFGSRPLDATLSLQGVIGGRLGIDLEGNYKIYRNKMIFVPAYDGMSITQMLASYRNVNQYSFQAEAIWRSQDVTVGGRIRYASYKDSYEKTVVTEMPAWTGDAFVRYNYRERLIAQLSCTYRSGTSGSMIAVWDYDVMPPTYEVPAIVDLDLNVNYMINKYISVFGKVGNLLNHRNQYMPLYLEPGRNFGGGICLNF
ncbi:MAG: TonB-dependent receptor [Bacteroidales bacterium]|nr:TonB-dependent receptor [Bacteroidales bacterium]